MATILLCGVDLFFRGKLEALLPNHRLITADHTDDPDLVLASDSGTVLKGAVLLAAYALGLGAAFLVAGIAFARAMSAFRWVRDRYQLIQFASGVTLVVLGALLFFHRDWWLHVALNRTLEAVGLTSP